VPVTVAPKAEEENKITKPTKAASLLMDRMDSPYSTIAPKTLGWPLIKDYTRDRTPVQYSMLYAIAANREVFRCSPSSIPTTEFQELDLTL
jgi:hypothetical protein